MADPFLGEVRIWGLTFAPLNWAYCDGQLLPIAQNQALYSLYATTFGGDGSTTFGLPDLRGRVPMHPDSATPQGVRAGVETVTLLASELAAHRHTLRAADVPAQSDTPVGHVFAQGPGATLYHEATNLVDLNSATVLNAGGGQPHDNVQPSLVLNFCLALSGLYPSRN